MKPIQLIFLIVGFVSCASPSKNLEKGNFEKAYKGVLNDLNKGSESRKDRSILNKSFDAMVKQFLTEEELRLRNSDVNDLEILYRDQDELIENYIKGKRWLDDDFDKVMGNQISNHDQLAYQISDFYLVEGNQLMDDYSRVGNKDLAKQAHKSYLKAQDYSGTNIAIDSLIDNALNEATVYIYLETKPWDQSMAWTINNKFAQLERRSGNYKNIAVNRIQEYVDCYLGLQFNDIEINDLNDVTTDNYSKEVIAGYENYIDSSGVSQSRPKYKTIKASIRCATHTRNFRWTLRSRINQRDNYCNYYPQTFFSEYSMSSKVFKVQGNRDALPDHLANLEDQLFPLRDNNVFEVLLDNLYDQIERHYFN